MRRIDLREGNCFTDSRRTRRVVGFTRSAGREFVVYSLGGDRLYHCLRETFLRWRRESIEITGCSIEMNDGGLVGEDPDAINA